MHQVAQGMNEMFSLKMIHRDIKPDNVFMDFPFRKKLGVDDEFI